MTLELEPRVKSLEDWRQSVEIARAKEETDRSYLDKRLDSIENDLKSINGGINKLIWAVVLAFIAAAVTFVVRGGLIA